MSEHARWDDDRIIPIYEEGSEDNAGASLKADSEIETGEPTLTDVADTIHAQRTEGAWIEGNYFGPEPPKGEVSSL